MQRTPGLLSVSILLCGLSHVAAPSFAADISTGLIGWWKFDEASGAIAADSSGNGVTGTLVGSPAWISGKLGNALSVNGTSQSVTIGDLNATDGTSSLTVAAWIYDAYAAASHSVLSKYNGARSAPHFVLQTSDAGKGGGGRDIMFALGSTNGYTTGSVHQANRWEHWVAVFDGSQTGNSNRLKIYLNGAQQTLTFSGTIPSTTSTSSYPIRIACDSDLSCFFGGRIDDARIYSRALSAADVSSLYAYTGSLPDTTPPTAAMTAPSPGTTVSGTITVSAAASDDVGITSVQFTLDGGSLGTAATVAPYQVSWDTSTAGNGAHTLSAVARDAAGNQTPAAGVTITVFNPPPTTKFQLNDRVRVSAGPLDVRATPSGTLLGTQQNNALGTIIGGPTNAGGFNWWNVNYDTGVDGWSAEDYLVAYTPDTQAPSIPGNLVATAISSSRIDLSWAASSDNVAVSGYAVFRDGSQVGTASAAAYSDIGLSPATTYTYTVSAYDAAGNNSNQSAGVPATTDSIAPSSGYPRLSEDGTYILDKNNQPFFMTGDAAWSLIAELDDSDALTYLSDRASRQFNTVLTNLIEHQYASRAPANIYGDLPFTGTAFRSSPNEAYFAHADAVLRQAESYGITVLLFPAYAGSGCGGQGWCAEMLAATDAQMYAWGQYVGNRYKDYPSLIWVIGADVDPPAYSNLQSRLNQVALGIRASDPNHSLMTAHNARGQSAMDSWAGYPWLSLNTVYETNTNMAAGTAAEYGRTGALPLFSIEDYYENEHSMTALDLRKEAYWAVLNGCTLGRVFGNNPLWAFSYLSGDWPSSLGSTGSVQAALVGRLMRSREFWLMAPDLNHTTMTAGYGSGSTLAVTSRCSNGHTSVSYIPAQRTVTIDLGQVSGTSARTWWFDPQTGLATPIDVFPTLGTRNFVPPDNNDWVLVIDDASLNLPAPGVMTGPDVTPPTVSLSAPSPGDTVSGSITVSAAAWDSAGIAGVRFTIDGGSLGTELSAPPFEISWNTATIGDGSHTLSAEARDTAGNTATAAPITVTVDNSAPAPTGSVVINSGSSTTNNTAVTLTLSATVSSGTVSQMQFSNTGSSFSAAEAYAPTKTWTLASGDGTKTVYVRFRGSTGNWSSSFSDSILLDTTAPVISSVANASVTSNSATITWITNEPATSRVEYGRTTGYGQTTALDSTRVTSHGVQIAGLAARTRYYYRVRSIEAAGNEGIGAAGSFRTGR